MNQQQQTVTTRPGGGAKSEKNGRPPTASMQPVESDCHPAATAGANTATMHTERPPTVTDGKKSGASKRDETASHPAGNRDGVVTLGIGSRDNCHKNKVKICAHCGREMQAKRPTKKYCDQNCRQAAWVARNPEKAAAKAARDKARLKAHILSRGGVWVDRE